METLVLFLVSTIATTLIYSLAVAKPPIMPVLSGMFVPKTRIFSNPEEIYTGLGILGATVMPHNLVSLWMILILPIRNILE